MIRCLAALALVGLLVLGACGDGETRTFRLELEPGSALEGGAVPFRVAVVRGEALLASDLRVTVTGEDGATYAFEVVPGTTLAFAADADAPRSPVVLPGLDADGPTPAESLERVKARLADRGLPVKVGPDGTGTAFLVALQDDREDKLAHVVDAVSGNADVRLLIEVRPSGLYGTWREGQVAPRLADGQAPWPGTHAEFDVFKAAEVDVFLAALEAGTPYVPSDVRYFVLPRSGSEAAHVRDFVVLEWPSEARFRLDQRMLENAVMGLDEVRRPAVFYDIRADYQEALEAFTGANVGLPLAICLDWQVITAPTIQSALSDRVQITLGSGPRREMEIDAKRIARALSTQGGILPARLVALARWGKAGAFEVWLPLPAEGEVTVAVDAQDQTHKRTLHAEVPLRYVPTAPTDAEQAVRASVASILLDDLSPGKAAPPLREFLPDSVKELAAVFASDAPLARRVVALDLLGRVDDASEVARSTVLRALGASEPELRLTAASALVGLEPSPAIVAALEGAVDDDEDAVALAAVRALEKIGGERPETVAALLGAAASDTPPVRSAARSALHAFLPGARPAIEKAAQEGEPRLRAAAVEVLGLEEAPETVGALVAFLADEVPEVRRAAASALWMHAMNRPDAMRPHLKGIAEHLGDEEQGVGSSVAQILVSSKEEGMALLGAALVDGSLEARSMALVALATPGEIPLPLLAQVRRAASDPSPLIRLLAGWTLTRRGHEDADLSAALGDALESDDAKARELGLQIAWYHAVEVSDLAPRLAPFLDDEDEKFRVNAAAVLERMGRPSEKTKQILDPVRDDPTHELHQLVSAD